MRGQQGDTGQLMPAKTANTLKHGQQVAPEDMLQLAEDACNSTGAMLPSAGFRLGGCQWCPWARLLQLNYKASHQRLLQHLIQFHLPKWRGCFRHVHRRLHTSWPPRRHLTCASLSTGGFCSSVGKGRCRQASRKIRHCVSTVRWKAESASCSLVSLEEVRYFKCRSPMPPAGAWEQGH